MISSDENLMKQALEAAGVYNGSDLPVGAIVVNQSGSVLTASKNAVITNRDPSAHAEIIALRQLGAISRNEAAELTLVVTLEPCPMCAWLIRLTGIGKVIFGAYNPNYGAAGSVFDLLRDGRFGLQTEVGGGVMEEACRRSLGEAFADIRHT